MTPGACFLGSFGRALSALALYGAGHPTLERAVDAACGDLEVLLASKGKTVFTFLEDTILLDWTPVDDLHGWEWSERMSAAGIQRVVFEAPCGREEVLAFLRDLAARLHRRDAAAHPVPTEGRTGSVRYGSLGLRGVAAPAEMPLRTATLGFSLKEEFEAVRWMDEEVRSCGRVPLLEAETVVRSLSVAMHQSGVAVVLPFIQLKEHDEYSTTHSLNVAVLAMGLAERVGLAGGDLHDYGLAALLHDVGKTLVPLEILNKAAAHSDEEREAMRRHPADGARLILRADEDLDLAAAVAYEHHIFFNGGGYPETRFARKCHPASRLVHVCDVFDALRTRRPYREAWPLEKALAYLRDQAGTEFDPEFVEPFATMVLQTDGVMSDEAE